MVREERKKNRMSGFRWSTWIPIILIITIAGILNCPYEYSRVGTSNVTSVLAAPDFPALQSQTPVMAGWPYRYLISHSNSSSVPGSGGSDFTRRFSSLALMLDVSIFLLLIGFWWIYNTRFAKRSDAGTRRLAIADLLIITALVAVPLETWRRIGLEREEEARLIAAVGRAKGSFSMSALLPAILDPWLPASAKDRLARVYEVRVEHPSNDLMTRLATNRNLCMLRVGGGSYQLGVLKELVANPHLEDLRIAARPLDGESINAIVQCSRLRTLNLMQTNVNASSLSKLERLPSLRRLNLMQTRVDLEEINDAPWSRNIEELVLGHPDPGQSARLKIADWPKLRSLTINRLDSQPNHVPMLLSIASMPKLSELTLDAFQKYDLQLSGLPVLEEIKRADYQWKSRLARGDSIPGELWCRHFSIDRAPQLTSLYLYVPELESFHLDGTPRIEILYVAAFSVSAKGEEYESNIKQEAMSALIEGLGASQGPSVIDLDAVNLKGVDLSPLTQNKGIKHLKMSFSATTTPQLKTLAPMAWLTGLELKECPIDRDGVQWALANFPKLREFVFAPVADEQHPWKIDQWATLEIVDKPELTKLEFGYLATEFLHRVKIINVPKLARNFDFSLLQTFEIRHAPAITGLSVHFPLPPNSVVEGVRDLSYFAAGGPHLTDEILSALTHCSKLTTIVLAYPKVTAKGLRSLPKLSNIKGLVLAGTPLNDHIVQEWNSMNRLEYLDLTDTSITGSALKKIVSPQLKVLRIGRSRVAPDSLAPLESLRYLTAISLAGIDVDAEWLTKFVYQNPLLQEIDLSETTISGPELSLFTRRLENLRILRLRGCEIEEKDVGSIFFDIVENNPKLRFDLGGAELPSRLMASLLEQELVLTADPWMILPARRRRDAEFDPGKFNVALFSDPKFASTFVNPVSVQPANTGSSSSKVTVADALDEDPK